MLTVDRPQNPNQGLRNESAFIAFLRENRLAILLVSHLILFTGVYWIAFSLRFDFQIPQKNLLVFWKTLPLVVFFKLALFYAMGSLHGWWRYVTFSDFITLLRTTSVASMAIVLIDYFLLNDVQIPRSIVLVDLILSIVVIGALRSTMRVWDERIAILHSSRGKDRALLIGFGFDAAKMAHLINSQPGNSTRVTGLVSPTVLQNKRQKFSDISVVGSVDQIEQLAETYRAKTVFVPNGTLPAREMRELLDTALEHDFKVRVVSALDQHLAGSTEIPVRDVSVEDLLRRDPVTLDTSAIEAMIEGKKILVTGAGGSIGSELCRQIAKFNPSCLSSTGTW